MRYATSCSSETMRMRRSGNASNGEGGSMGALKVI
jgi:hypothetical protein